MLNAKAKKDIVAETFKEECKLQDSEIIGVHKAGNTIGVELYKMANVHNRTTDTLEKHDLKISGITVNDDSDSVMIYVRSLNDL